MNLITNSSEAIGDNIGEISITSGVMACTRDYLLELEPSPKNGEKDERPEGPYVFLEVKDTGRGMDEETLHRLFDPFFTTKFTGRGLGMAAVLGIMRGHKGCIQVSSEKSVGTSILVMFPATGTTPSVVDKEPDESVLKDVNLVGARVLLADDEEQIRDIGKTMLENLGMIVTLAVDGEEAVSCYTNNPDQFDFVLLDLTMPKLDGTQVFDQIIALNPEAKVILVSGYGEQDATADFADRGLAGFIQKPFKLKDLKRSLLLAS